MEPASKLFLSPHVRQSLLNDLSLSRKSSSSSVGRNSSLKKGIRKNSEKPQEFSDRVRELARRMMFKVKLYILMNKAKRRKRTKEEQLNPGYYKIIKTLQNTFRSNANSEFLLEYLKPLSFFAKFIKDLGDVEDTAIIELCKRIKYEYAPSGSCIFEEGAKSNEKFYVILKGSVSVVRKTDQNVFVQENIKDQGDKGEKVERDTGRKETFLLGTPYVKKENEVDVNAAQIRKYGTKVSELKEGEGFGEKALLAKNSRRTATIIANTNCDLLVIMKEDYVDIISKYDRRRHAKIKFMKEHIPYLNYIVSSEIWENLFHHIKETDFTKGTILASEGAPGRTVYFIQDGCCDLEKTIIKQEKKGQVHLEIPKIKKKIATFGPGNSLGEEVLMQKEQKYEYTITVSSSIARIYHIDRSTMMGRFPKECIRALIENYTSKETVHLQKLKKFAEEFNNQTYVQNPSMIKAANLRPLMAASTRHSLANQIKRLHAKEEVVSEKFIEQAPASASFRRLPTSQTKTRPSIELHTPIHSASATHRKISFAKKDWVSRENLPLETEENLSEAMSPISPNRNSVESPSAFERLSTLETSIFRSRGPEPFSPAKKKATQRTMPNFSTQFGFATESNLGSSRDKKGYLHTIDDQPSITSERFDFGASYGVKNSAKSRFSLVSERAETENYKSEYSPSPTFEKSQEKRIALVLGLKRHSSNYNSSYSHRNIQPASASGFKLNLNELRMTEENQSEKTALQRVISTSHAKNRSQEKILDPRVWTAFSEEKRLHPINHHTMRPVLEISKREEAPIREVETPQKEVGKGLVKNFQITNSKISVLSLKAKKKIQDSLNPKKQKQKLILKTMQLTPQTSLPNTESLKTMKNYQINNRVPFVQN